MFEAVILTVIPDLIQKDFDALLPLVSPDKQERIICSGMREIVYWVTF